MLTVRAMMGKVTRFWGQESAMRRRLINTGHLITGNAVNSVIGLIAFVVTARALGPADYGVLALTYSYVRAVQQLVSFQSWQPLIKYGAELKHKVDHSDLVSLLKFGLIVDFSAAVLACVTAIAVALVASPLVGISEDALDQVLIYSVALVFQINGLPTAVIRLAGRFRELAYTNLISNAARMVLCAIGLATGAELFYFVLVWAATQILGALILLGITVAELRRQGILVRDVLFASLRGVNSRFKGLWSFTLGSNAELTIRASAGEFDVLLVGMLADPTSAGLYHIAKRLGRLVLQLGVQVQAVLYPDIARLWAQRAIEALRRTVFQMEILLALFGVAAIIGTAIVIEPLLAWTAGPEFAAAAPLAIVQMVGVALGLSGGPLRSALLAMGKQTTLLKYVTLAAITFQVVAWTTIPFFGAMGANFAHLAMDAVTFASLTILYRRELATLARVPVVNS